MRWLLVAAAGLVGSVLLERIGERRAAMRFPAPGRMLRLDGRTLHIHETGNGSVPVILESGLAASSVSWSLVQSELAAPDSNIPVRCVSYDRAGLGWSTRGSGIVTLDLLVTDLKAVIDAVAPSQPVVLIGHSFGALIILAFAARHASRVAALLLVDPVSIRHWAKCSESDRRRLQLAVRLSRRGAWMAALGLVRFALRVLAAGGTSVPKLIARAGGRKGSGFLARLTGEMSRLPSGLWPTVMSHWSRAHAFRSLAAYLEALPQCALEASDVDLSSSIPIRILSAGTATSSEIKERDDLVAQSVNGHHLHLPRCGHWIQLQDPTAIATAIRDVIFSGSRS